MDAAGLGLAVFTTFKELYLLSKFICRTVASAKNSDREKNAIEEEFRMEVLYLRSLGVLFFQQLKISDDKNFDREWLALILNVFDRLRILCGDYAKIATEQDKEYQSYSPYLNSTTARSKVIEFDLELEAPPQERQVFDFTVQGRPALKWLASKFGRVEGWKWALFEKRKLEQLLRDYQKWIGKLKELVPLVLAFSIQRNDSIKLIELERDNDAARLGLLPHVRVRQHLEGLKKVPRDRLLLGDVVVDGPIDADSVVVAEMILKQDKGDRQQNEPVLLEYKAYQSLEEYCGPDEDTASRVEQLANLLSCSENSDLNTLPFQGYVLEEDRNRYAFLFKFPNGVVQQQPQSLYHIIDSPSTSRLTLNQRFRVAQGIAKALGALHNDGWVHKSFRSRSIVFFSNPDQESNDELRSYGKPFLVDFQFSRPEAADTQYTFDNFVEHNVYRHPDRQGIPTIRFSKIHDIYALGVVLLEIGISQTAIAVHREACQKVKHGVIISPRGIQNIFMEIARRRLAHSMGQSYLEAVQTCLSGSLRDSIASNHFPMVFRREVIDKINFNGWD